MANILSSRLGLLEEPETRKPSKVRLALLVLFLLLLILSAVFIGLYIKEKIAFDRSSSKKTKHTEVPYKPTECPFEQTNDTERPCQPCEKTKHIKLSSETCVSATCITSAAGMFKPSAICSFAGRKTHASK